MSGLVERTANQIDYAGLYGAGYYGHAEGATSFKPQLANVVQKIAASLNLTAVLDIGAGNAELARQLRNLGLRVVSADIRADSAGGVIGFDLTSGSPAALEELRKLIDQQIGGDPYLLTCLDVLEHIGPDDLAEALKTLQTLTARWALISVSTRPSSDHNAYHATVAPLSNWMRALSAAQLEIREYPGLREVSQPLYPPVDDRNWSFHHWWEMDPYREARGPEPNYLLLEKTGNTACARELMWAGMGPRLNEWAAGSVDPEVQWTFLIGHVQDFSAYLPFWSILPRSSVRVILRRSADGVIDDRQSASMRAWLRARGIRFDEIARTKDWYWESAPKRAFISHSESNMGLSHLLNSAFCSVARYHGYRTFLLQHGLLLEDSAQPVGFASENLLIWGEQHRTFFESPSPHTAAAHRMPRGLLPDMQVRITGCPKFDVYAAAPYPTMEQILGAWTLKYQRRVVCTTNLHWTEHKADKSCVAVVLSDLARAFPGDLFILKPHPAEVFPAAVDLLPENVVILDEFFCWWAGIKTADLIRAADLAISTKSTTLLEIALAGKPCIALDTHNRIPYEDVALTPLGEVSAALAARPDARAYNSAFAGRFYDLSTLGRALADTVSFVEEKIASPGFLSLAAARAICFEKAMGEHLTSRVEECRQLSRDAKFRNPGE